MDTSSNAWVEMDPFVSLSEIQPVAARIDAVEEDIRSGRLVYAAIPPWELGRLLGLEWEDAPADWAYQTLAAKRRLDEAGFDRPFAENLSLLDGRIPPDRLAELEGLAGAVLEQESGPDLPLSADEIALLEKRFSEEEAQNAQSIGLARTHLVSADGFHLHFEVIIGDGGVLEDPKGPYEHQRGAFLNISDWIEID